MRLVAAVALLIFAGACRPYQKEAYLASPDGLIPADRFAAYGTEQAQAMAIGRELGGDHGRDRTAQFTAAIEFAKTQPDVVEVIPDTIGYRLQVKFKSGWIKGVVPIDDGKHGAETANLPQISAAPGQ
jgi:hypothetical protein